MLKDAPIVILDEATTGLDAESERLIQEAVRRLAKQRTTLVIAHHLATIRSADHIIFIDNGRILEQGTHGELMALSGQYAAFHRLQYGVGSRAGRAVSTSVSLAL